MPRNTLLHTTKRAFGGRLGAEPVRALTTLAGALLVVVGGYLPWLRPNPDHEGLVLSPQLRPGFEWVDLVLIVPVGLVVVFLAARGPTKWWTRTTAVVGLVSVLLPALVPLSLYIDPAPPFVPALGLASTVLGGLLLLVAVGYNRFTTS